MNHRGRDDDEIRMFEYRPSYRQQRNISLADEHEKGMKNVTMQKIVWSIKKKKNIFYMQNNF